MIVPEIVQEILSNFENLPRKILTNFDNFIYEEDSVEILELN